MILQQPPPMPVYQINSQDESQLKVISICHYVMAGFYLLGIAFVILHFMLMSFVFRMTETERNTPPVAPAPLIVENTSPATNEELPEGETSVGSPSELLGIPPSYTPPPAASASTAFPKEVMPILMGIYVIISCILIALCVCNVLSGRYISKRKNRLFSFIIAGINCMQFPLGTALGVFTFIVLTKENVNMAYSVNVQN